MTFQERLIWAARRHANGVTGDYQFLSDLGFLDPTKKLEELQRLHHISVTKEALCHTLSP